MEQLRKDRGKLVINETIRTLQSRTSLRQFAEKSVSEEVKDLLFDCAMKAPTAGNQMLYTMIDVTDQDLKDKLAVACDNQPFIAKAPMVVFFGADQQKWFDYFERNDVKGFCDRKEDMVFEAPQESDLLLACEDAMIAAQNMVIAAESLGMGSCYIGDILENYEYIKGLLALPDWVFPIGMLVLGYRDPDKKQVHRKRFDKKYVVFENAYKRLSGEEIDDMFSDLNQHYKSPNKFDADNIAQFFYARKTGAAFSKEMARSVRVALKKWDGRIL